MSVLVACNPLLDIQSTQSSLLEKYNLKSNDAVLASPEQMKIYEEIVQDDSVTYLSGGSGQNSCRAAAYILGKGKAFYIGAVGDDKYAQTLREKNSQAGVISEYQIVNDKSTGTCACIISGQNRSLVTNLGAAESFDSSHLKRPSVAELIKSCSHFYISGFFLTHGLASALELCKAASASAKTVLLNLSAPFICHYFKVQVEEILPYVDILIANDSEATAWGESCGLADSTPQGVAAHLAAVNKINAARPRTVIITQGSEPTVLACTERDAKLPAGRVQVRTFPVPAVPKEEIQDTNGAGDAFVGGLVAELCKGQSIEKAIETGHYLGGLSIRQIGANLPSAPQ